MKVVYIGDFQRLPNWGCRATGAALAELVETEHEIIERIGMETLHGTGWDAFAEHPFVYGGVLPRRIFHSFWPRRHTRPRSTLMVLRLLRLAGARFTFLSNDPTESVRQFHLARRYNDRLKRIYAAVEAADALVFNGEGTMIFSTPSRNDVLYTLFLIRLGLDLGKRVYFFNAMFSDCPYTPRSQPAFAATAELLAECTAVACRDRESVNLMGLEHKAGANVTTIPDALFTWRERVCAARDAVRLNPNGVLPFGSEHLMGAFDFSRPFICLSGSSSAEREERRADAYTAVAQALRALGLPIYLVATCAGDWFMHEVAQRTGLPLIPQHIPVMAGAGIMAAASLLVSGRFHPSIMASLGGTPAVFFGSNSHKTRSLQKVLGYETTNEFSHVPTDAELPGIVSRARTLVAEGEERRRKISATVTIRSHQAKASLELMRGAQVTPFI